MQNKKGLLLPVYSLPSKYGIGEFSKEAFLFIDKLKDSGLKIWQILGLAPSGYEQSSYLENKTYILDDAYISLDDLYSRELISKPIPYNSNSKSVVYEDVVRLKRTYYLEAYFTFVNKYGISQIRDFGNDNKEVKEYAILKAKETIKDVNNKERFNLFVNYNLFLQMVLNQEWIYLVKHANDAGINLLVFSNKEEGIISCLEILKNKHYTCFDVLGANKSNPKFKNFKKIDKYLKRVNL